MRFKIKDTVKVSNKGLDAYGAVGIIVDIDEEWDYPYEVDFGDKSFKEELFMEYDLTLAEEDEEVSSTKKNPKDYIDIKFQEGVIDTHGVNGAQIEDVIDILVDRLQGFQRGQFPCRENALAITHLQEAQNWLYRRTMVRKKQGVEGKNERHE